MTSKKLDPVHQGNDGRWYFWNEVWADKYGPYDSEKECREVLDEYVKELEKEETNNG